MKAETYFNDGDGIKCVYKNNQWLVSIKNWKPDNDIDQISHLEVHHATDEQFILTKGKAILIIGDRMNDRFEIELIRMEIGKVYNVPQETWFYTITQKDTKMMYIQAADTSMENSEFRDLTQEELDYIRENARILLEM